MQLEIIRIQKILEQQMAYKSNLYVILNIILDAVNDWPDEVLSFERYVEDVQNFLKAIPTKKSIEYGLVSANFNIDSWKIESMTQILQLYKHFPEEYSLQQIVQNINMDFPDQ